MYADRIACCPLSSHVQYAPRAPLRLEKKTPRAVFTSEKDGTDGRTDRRTPDRSITLSARRSQRNSVSTSRYITSTTVSAAADRPARRSGSAHAKYSVSHHMVIKSFLLLGLADEYRSRRWV